MDLLYANPSQECRKELENLGAEIEDASDFIHQERVAIYYPEEKKQDYHSILKKYSLLKFSFSYLIQL